MTNRTGDDAGAACSATDETQGGPAPMPTPALNCAAIYVKANGWKSPDAAEVDVQMAEAEDYCKGRGLQVNARYTDGPRRRDGFHRMMADAGSDEPQFDHVVVWKLVYFAWSMEESILAQEKLRANGVRVFSVKERMFGDYP